MQKLKVRFGGLETPIGYRFEITGGHLALDLANTVDVRPTPGARDLLDHWDRLVDWSQQAGVVSAREAGRLRRDGSSRPEEALAVLRRVRFVREAIHGVFRAVADARPVPSGDLAIVNDALPFALARLRLERREAGLSWTWAHPEGALDVMLPPVIRAASELLVDPDRRSRVRACEASRTCGWLFLDLSRNRSRRWCDMSVCGNREKARRHYARAIGRARRRTATR